MALVVDILDSGTRRDPYAGIYGTHGRQMLELYRLGAKLYVWRGSTPHNWWLETADGVSHTVAGDRETNGILGIVHLNTPEILQALGRKVFTSAERIEPHALHRDGGQPSKEGWEFDSLRVATLEAEWAEVQTSIQVRKDNPPVFRPNLTVLSEEALALLRLLKAVTIVYPYVELLRAFSELDAQGFLVMTESGSFELTPEGRDIRIPRGQRMKLKFSSASD